MIMLVITSALIGTIIGCGLVWVCLWRPLLKRQKVELARWIKITNDLSDY